MKRLIVLFAACLTFSLAQEGFVGKWEGVIGPGVLELGILVQFEFEAQLSGSIDIPVQQARGLTLRIEEASAERAVFVIDGIPGNATFTGTLLGDSIEGSFEQGGQSFPFELRRMATAHSEMAVVEELLGNWQGVIGEGLIDLGIGLSFDAADDLLIGRIAIPAQSFEGELAILEASASKLVARIVGIPGEATFDGQLSEDEIRGTFSQAGQELEFRLERTAEALSLRRPQEPERPLPYLEEDVSLQSGDVTLAGTLTLPEGEGPFAAVLFISGSGAQDRDEAIAGHRPFLVLSDVITQAGLATLRFDDRGIGGSTGELTSSSYQDLVADILVGVDYLKHRTEIDPGRIGLFGHSEGGYLAPLAASVSEDIAFVIMMAGPAVPGLEVLLQQNRDILALAGSSEEAIEQQLAFLETLATTLEREAYDEATELIEAQLLDTFANLAEDERPTEAVQQLMISGQQASIATPYFRDFILYNPERGLRQLNVPLLALYGDLDIQVAWEANVAALQEITVDKADVTIEVFTGLNHLLQPALTGSLEEYAQIDMTVAPEVLELLTSWLQARFLSP